MIPFTPRDGDFIRELLGDLPPPRFDLRASVDGYEIYDRGEVICVFRGPQFRLAGKVLGLLRADASQSQPCADAQERSPLSHNLLKKDADR